MKSLVVYESQYGNTEKIAKAIGAQLAAAGPARVVALDHPDAFATEGIDLLVVGGPTQGHGLSARLRDRLQQMPADAFVGVAAATFDTRLSGPKLLTGSAADSLAHQLKAKGALLAGPSASFIVRGKEGPLGEGELDRAATWAATLSQQVPAPATASRP